MHSVQLEAIYLKYFRIHFLKHCKIKFHVGHKDLMLRLERLMLRHLLKYTLIHTEVLYEQHTLHSRYIFSGKKVHITLKVHIST